MNDFVGLVGSSHSAVPTDGAVPADGAVPTDSAVPSQSTASTQSTARSDLDIDVVERLKTVYLADYRQLVGLAGWIVGGRAMAEELVQDTFVRLLERPPRLDDPAALGSYVRAAVVNRSRSRFRRLVLERRHATGPPDPVELDGEAAGVDRAVRAAVASLPRRQRECVVLRFYGDLTVEAIATTLGITAGSVKTHLHRATTTLEGLLSGGDDR
ncbi:MAG: RNA polymerase sigma factor [Acidimicrobiales bacterium]